jgi:hypothetical protein
LSTVSAGSEVGGETAANCGAGAVEGCGGGASADGWDFGRSHPDATATQTNPMATHHRTTILRYSDTLSLQRVGGAPRYFEKCTIEAMPRVAPNVPSETDLLCETCGYILNGLPPDGNCPECGTPVDQSTGPDTRQPSAWERDRSFFATTAEVIFRPTRFFRRTITRGDLPVARRFGSIHTAIASALFAAAGILHLAFEIGRPLPVLTALLGWFVLAILTFNLLTITTRIASRLTTWEATYRGYRLPLPVVRRALAFHAAHYLPVALAGLLTTAGYQIALQLNPNFAIHGIAYLEVLSSEVVLGAAYLFHTYWIAMRKMMYANY